MDEKYKIIEVANQEIQKIHEMETFLKHLNENTQVRLIDGHTERELPHIQGFNDDLTELIQDAIISLESHIDSKVYVKGAEE